MRRIALALASLLLAASTAHAGGAILNVSPSFRAGPYTSLSVDPLHPLAIAVGTSDGHVLWSEDGGATSRESLVLSGREYVSAPLRSGGKLIPLAGQRQSGRSQYSGLSAEPGGTRLFLFLLKEGIPVVKWQYWMSIENPNVEVAQVGLPSSPTDGLTVATPGGIFVSDPKRGAWARTLGVPRPKGEDVGGLAAGIDPSDSRHILVGTSQGLFVSRDGGNNFFPHPDRKLAKEEFHKFIWDVDDSQHILALTADAVFQSHDGGATFAEALSTRETIHSLAMTAEGAYLATSKGLLIPSGEGETKLFKNESVVGVVPLGQGWILAATEEAIYLRTQDGEQSTLLRASPGDPILHLEGNSTVAWALTRYGIFRIGGDEVTRDHAAHPPHIALSSLEVERAVVEHMGIGDATKTRLFQPWYAKLFPKITVNINSPLGHDYSALFDYSLPIRYRQFTASTSSSCCGALPGQAPAEVTAFATWDLSFLLKIGATNPFGMIEMNLRAMREQILPEVRVRYREAANLTNMLKRPPRDPETHLLWRMRLAEHASYLQALSGVQVVAFNDEEEEFPW